MFPIRTERDVAFINWQDQETTFSTARGNGNENMYIKSDGLVYTDFAHFAVMGDVTLSNNQVVIAGVHLTGPAESESETQYTLYAYQVSAWTIDPEIGLALCVGISGATPDATATDDIIDARYIHMGHKTADDICGLKADGVIALKAPFDEHGAGYENRGICFGIAAMAGLTSSTAASHTQGYISVRRLVGPLPSMLDKFKLG